MYHNVELTYYEIKYLLEYLKDSRAKQVYFDGILESHNLEGVSKRIAYLNNVEGMLIEGIKNIEKDKQKYGSIKLNRN